MRLSGHGNSQSIQRKNSILAWGPKVHKLSVTSQMLLHQYTASVDTGCEQFVNTKDPPLPP